MAFYVPNKYTIHAEERCFMELSSFQRNNILKDSVLYVVKLDAMGNFKYFEPCEQCSRIIKKYKVKKVICCV
jgi:deoxycytidylate deaminase